MNNQQNKNKTFRLLIDPQPNSGQRNMAIDETLLDYSVLNHQLIFRLYEWSEPTISLGYFQKQTSSNSDPRFLHLPHVRRLSGGGAILHHHELTYSFVVPQSHHLANDPTFIYQFLHHVIIKSLKSFRIQAEMRSQDNKEVNNRYLCFERGDSNDILIGNHKIVGSAQRRRKGNILQHGSILLRTSELANEYPGLEELTQKTFLLDQFKQEFVENLSASLSLNKILSNLTVEEELLVDQLIKEKYQFLEWNPTR